MFEDHDEDGASHNPITSLNNAEHLGTSEVICVERCYESAT